MSPLDQRWENFGAHSLFFFFLSKIVHLLIEICPLARAGDTPLKAGIPFRGASPTLLTPPGKFKGELCGHLKTVTLGPALGKLWSTFPFLFLFVENRPFTQSLHVATVGRSGDEGIDGIIKEDRLG